jgi:hypothetical protein
VPDYRTFDPILAGIASPDAPVDSAEFFGGVQYLVQRYFLDHVSVLTGLPRFEIGRISMAATPTMFTVAPKIGRSAQVARNGVVAGDSFGNGDYLSSGGMNVGMIGHAYRVRQFWLDEARGVDRDEAMARLAGSIRQDTQAWIDHSIDAFRQPPAAVPVAGMTPEGKRRKAAIEETRRLRRSVNPIDYNDQWSRITLFVGRLHAFPLPELGDEPADLGSMDPEMSPAVAAAMGYVMETPAWPERVEAMPMADVSMDGMMDGDRMPAMAGGPEPERDRADGEPDGGRHARPDWMPEVPDWMRPWRSGADGRAGRHSADTDDQPADDWFADRR